MSRDIAGNSLRKRGPSESERRKGKADAMDQAVRAASHHTGTLNAYQRHRELIVNYKRYGGVVPTAGALDPPDASTFRGVTDTDVLRRRHRFVRDEEEDLRAEQARAVDGTDAYTGAWEVRMAARYYQRLFKEYALADLSRYAEGKVGLRWRTEKEVVNGKGHFVCGNLRCEERQDLHSYEVNFRYKEEGQVKNELVKVRVCAACARKLFHKKLAQLERQRRREKEERRRKRRGRDGKKRPRGEGEDDEEEGEEDDDDDEEGVGGHDLIRRVVAGAAATSGGAQETSGRGNKRWARWGDAGAGKAVGEGAGATKGGWEGSGEGENGGGGDGCGGGGGSGGAGGAAGGEGGGVNPWAEPLKPERTVLDEMDDYFNSLLQ